MATAAKPGHMSMIGKAGFRKVLETKGFSDAGHLIAWFVEKGIMRPKKEDTSS